MQHNGTMISSAMVRLIREITVKTTFWTSLISLLYHNYVPGGQPFSISLNDWQVLNPLSKDYDWVFYHCATGGHTNSIESVANVLKLFYDSKLQIFVVR